MMFLKNHLKYRVIKTINFENYLWMISLEIIINKNKYLFTVIYHPPAKEDIKFLKKFEEYLDEIGEFPGNKIIMGDFNYDLNLTTSYIQKYKDLIYKNGLDQIVNQSTRVTSQSATIIDHVITNIKNDIKVKVISTPRISDHYILHVSIDDFYRGKRQTNVDIMFECRNYKKYDKNLFHEVIFHDKIYILSCCIVINVLL